MQGLGRILILAGAVLVIAGLLVNFADRLPFRLGRLPGDVVWRGKNSTFYFPLVTCLIISAVLTLLAWISRNR